MFGQHHRAPQNRRHSKWWQRPGQDARDWSKPLNPKTAWILQISEVVSTPRSRRCDEVHAPIVLSKVSDTSTAFQLNIRGALSLGLAEIVFAFLFVDLFDNVGTLLAVGKKAGFFTVQPGVPRLNRILYSDAIATIAVACRHVDGSQLYRKLRGVAAGGRSGVTAIVTGLLFVVALFVAPLAGTIPSSATAPALIIVGSMMMTTLTGNRVDQSRDRLPRIPYHDRIPLTFSIANGLAFGFCAYTLLKILRGRFRDVNWMVYLLTVLFLVRFWFISRRRMTLDRERNVRKVPCPTATRRCGHRVRGFSYESESITAMASLQAI